MGLSFHHIPVSCSKAAVLSTGRWQIQPKAGSLRDMSPIVETLCSNWHLAVLTGPDAGTVIPLSSSTCVGRGELLHDPEISRDHLRFRVRQDSVSVCDGGSTNGTYLRPPRRWKRVLHTQTRKCQSGTRLYLGSTTLELRRRPASLVISTPPEPQHKIWQKFLPLLLIVVMLPAAIFAFRRSPVAGLMMAPLLLMFFTRIESFSELNFWRQRRLPSPSHLLLSVTARTQSKLEILASEQPPAAWLGYQCKQREVLRLHNGDCIALVGAQANTVLRWWCAQILATGRATLRITARQVQVSWGSDGTQQAKLLPAEPGQIPSGALRVVQTPSRLPELSESWWKMLLEAAGITLPPDLPGQIEPQLIPERVLLESVTGKLSAPVIYSRWQEQHCCGVLPQLQAVMGVGAAGEQSVDLVKDGPHALLAGTTGSGKSELLTSWLLQLAINYSPARLSFVLVDYKGGAAFAPLAELPHTAGVLTDLDPAGTERALASLQAEIQRRERLLREQQTKDVFSLTSENALPHLVVAVDEFATLASEHPDILHSLIRVAAQGRSLGIHLILATQRPGGAISPAIRANTTIRACLRVLDEADSRDVLGTTAAAHLPLHPGRLLLADSSQELQSPWCADAEHLTALIALLQQSAGENIHSWRPWADPLPASQRRDELVSVPAAAPSTCDQNLLLARTDLPQQQKLGIWYWQVRSPLLILGAPGSGRSSTLQSLAVAALNQGIGVHYLGQTPNDMRLQAGCPGMGTVAPPYDGRRMARLLELAVSGALRGNLVCLDDVDLLLSSLDEVLGAGEGMSRLETLIRLASALGVHLALSAPLTTATARWAESIGQRLVLGATQPGQAALAGLPSGTVCSSGAGRGIILAAGAATSCQVLLPGINERFQGQASPLALEPLPHRVCQEEVPSGAIGVGGDLGEPIFLSAATNTVLVAGPPGSGKSNALSVLANSLDSASPLVVDDLDQADMQVTAEVERALAGNQLVLASATTEQVARTYHGPLAALRERGALLLLWPESAGSQAVTGVPLRGLWDPGQPLLPGRAVLIQRGQGLPLQVVNTLPTKS